MQQLVAQHAQHVAEAGAIPQALPGYSQQTYLRRRLNYSIGSRLPGHNCHLFLYGLDVWGLIWLRPVSEGDHSLCIYTLLFGPIL